MAFADVADVGAADQVDGVAGDALRLDFVPPRPFERRPQGFELVRVVGRLLADAGPDIVALDVGDVEPEGGQIAGVGRHHRGNDSEKIGDLRREQPARAAEGDHRVIARVEAARGGDAPDAVHLVGRGDLQHAGGGFLGRDFELAAELFVGRPGRIGVELQPAADQRLRQPAEHQPGVGHRRLGAAAAIADRPRVGARALRSHLERAVFVDPGERPAAGPDRLDVEHRRLDRIALDRRVAGELGRQVADQRHVGRRAADIEGEHVPVVGEPCHMGRAEHAPGRPGNQHRHRLLRRLRAGHDAAVRLHDQERHRAGAFPDAALGMAEIGLAVGFHHDVDQGRHGALVFAVFRQDDGGKRDVDAGVPRGHQLADPVLVRRVGVGMEQADGEPVDPERHQLVGRGEDPVLVERRQLGAVVAHPPGRLAHQVQRHETFRLHPEERVSVAVGHRLAGDLDQVAEAFGDQQPEPFEPVLQHRVGRRRRAVQDLADPGPRRARRFQHLVDAVEQAEARIGGRARRLDRELVARLLVERDHVGKGAAGVYGDAERHDSFAISRLYPLPGHDIVTHPPGQSHAPRRRGPARPGFPIPRAVRSNPSPAPCGSRPS